MIAVEHLTRRFESRLAVDDVTFGIGAGEIFCLLGPNGAGKTTTMRMMAGLIAPTSGRVEVNGIPLSAATGSAVRERIGFLTEAPGLWERLSVRLNLAIYARLYRRRDPDDAAGRLLETFGLADRAEESAGTLSKGLKQRLALARALVHDPAIVLLDEPTSGLDPQSARGVRELILSLRREGRAILVSTHNLDEAERIADRVAVLQTRLRALDTPAALRQHLFGRRVRIVFGGAPRGATSSLFEAAAARDVNWEGEETVSFAIEDADAQVPALVRALVGTGASIRQVVDEQPPLEEVYLRLID